MNEPLTPYGMALFYKGLPPLLAGQAQLSLEKSMLIYFFECVPRDYYIRISVAQQVLECSYDLARAVLRDLKAKKFVEYKRGLFTEYGEMAGAGYGLTALGYNVVQALVED